MSKNINNNKPKKTKIPDNGNVLVRWLKRIFSAQTITIFLSGLSLFVAIIGAYYGYKSYKDNHSPDLSVKYILYGQAKKLQGKHVLRNLIRHGDIDIRRIPFKTKYMWENFIEIPSIVNSSNRSIKNFYLEVLVSFRGLEYYAQEVSKDFEIIEEDTVFGDRIELTLRYKYNTLRAKQVVPIPLEALYIPKHTPISKDEGYKVEFDYSISYDGIAYSHDFDVIYSIYLSRDRFPDTVLDKYLTDLYNEGAFKVTDDFKTISVVIDDDFVKLINPPLDITKDEFEEYKIDYINKHNRRDMLTNEYGLILQERKELRKIGFVD